MAPSKKIAAPLPLDDPGRRRLPILLRRAWYGLNQAFRRRIAHTGVTPDQFTVLRTILEAESHGLVQSELSDRMASDPNTIASLLERMESAELVERFPHEKDRRAYRIRLLPTGQRKYADIRKIALDLQEEVLQSVPESSREEFLEQLGKVGDACQAAADSTPKPPSQKTATRRGD
jgi:DNA-binding MarR family transcriptional regulator